MLYLQFCVNRERYIIETRHIKYVVPLLKTHKTAGYAHQVPHYMCGFIRYQDKTIPVVDLSKLISGKKSKPYLSTRIILTEHVMENNRQDTVGFIVENATEVVRLVNQDFTHDAIRKETAPYMGPIAEDSKGLLRQLNICKLIDLMVVDYINRPALLVE